MSNNRLSKLNGTGYFKIIASSAIVLLGVYAIILGCRSAFVNLLSRTCGNDVLEEVYSPDRQYKVVTFQSDCGATTRLHTHISLLKANQKLSNLSRGNLLSLQEAVNIEAAWKSNRSVQIIYSPTLELPVEKTRFQYFNQIFEIEYRAKVKD